MLATGNLLIFKQVITNSIGIDGNKSDKTGLKKHKCHTVPHSLAFANMGHVKKTARYYFTGRRHTGYWKSDVTRKDHQSWKRRSVPISGYGTLWENACTTRRSYA